MSVWSLCAKAYVRNNVGFYSFVPEQYGQLLEAWKGGKTFFTGTTVDGDEITVKLAEVESVMFSTPENQEAAAIRGKRESKAVDSETFE